MPILSVFLGSSNTSFLLYKSSSDYNFYTFPYAYSSVYSLVSKKEFYMDIFDFATGKLGLNHAECEVIYSAVLFPEILGFEAKKSSYLHEVLTTKQDLMPYYVDLFSIVVPGEYLVSSPFNTNGNAFRLNEPEKANFLANTTLYTNSEPRKDFDVFDRDDTTRFLANSLKNKAISQQQVVFTGERFSSRGVPKSLTALLVVDLVKPAGIYNLQVDTENKLPLVMHLNSYKKNTLGIYSSLKFDSIGTLINVPGGVECLVKSSVGTSQLIELGSGLFQIIPIEKDTISKVSIKHETLGHATYDVKGEGLGLIIDTRIKQDLGLQGKAETRHKNYRSWEHAIEENIKQL